MKVLELGQEQLLSLPSLPSIDLQDQQQQAQALAEEIARFDTVQKVTSNVLSIAEAQVFNLTANVRPVRLPYFAQ